MGKVKLAYQSHYVRVNTRSSENLASHFLMEISIEEALTSSITNAVVLA